MLYHFQLSVLPVYLISKESFLFFFFQLIRMRKTQKEKEITKLTRQKKFDMSESVMQA